MECCQVWFIRKWKGEESMFDTVKIGKRVAQLRKDKNMTQMELADRMGVSYQAVSNWERGNSMPDIAKLKDLSEILGVTVDALLDTEDDTSVNLVKHIMKDEEPDSFIEQNGIHFREVASIAPALKPEQAEKLVKAAWKSQEKEEKSQSAAEKKIDWNGLIAVAPFLRNGFLDSFVLEEADSCPPYEILCGLAPFLKRQTISYFMEMGSAEECSPNILAALAPFAGEEAVSRLFQQMMEKQTFSMEDICALAPFTNKELLSEAARKVQDIGSIEKLSCIVPFIDREVLEELFCNIVKEQKPSLEDLCVLAPFVGKEQISKVMETLSQKVSFCELAMLAPFADKNVLERFFNSALEQENPSFEDLYALAPFLERESLSKAAAKLCGKGNLEQFVGLAPFVDGEVLQELIIKAVEKEKGEESSRRAF